MIVADTNLIAYFLIKGPHTGEAEGVYLKDREWIAPVLWRSEFRNVLVLSLRRGLLSLGEASELMGRAERLMMGHEYQVASSHILGLAAESGCTAYDCEFAALAQGFGILLVTSDRELLANFKPIAVSMLAFCS